jgi:imidazolonepropionase-like amidohydrolase
MRFAKITFAFTLMPLILPGCAHMSAPIEADYVFENVNLVPMNEEIVLADKAVAVRDGVIVAIIGEDESPHVRTGRRIDGGGTYLLPGLADMHVHLRIDPRAFFNLQLANGVTTVHNMGNGDGGGKIDHVALRADVAAGKTDGPRYLISGPQLHKEQLSTPADVRAVLDNHLAHGFDTIKVHGNLAPDVYDALIEGAHARGFRVTGHAQRMMPLAQTLRMDAMEHIEEFLYMSRDDVFATAAAGSEDNFLDACYANIARLADAEYRAAIVRDVAASGIYVDATLIIYAMLPVYFDDQRFGALHGDPRLAYVPEQIRKGYLDPEKNPYRDGLAPALRDFLDKVGADTTPADHVAQNIEMLSTLMGELHEAGVPLLLGTDAFGALVPGFAVHQELEMMVAAELTPYEALQTGTVNAARYLGEAGEAGTIEVGKRADFILVAGNPLKDVGNAAAVRGVFSQGKWRSAHDLQVMLEQAKELVSNAN